MLTATDDLYIGAILRRSDYITRRCHVDLARRDVMARCTLSSNLTPLHVLSPQSEKCPFACPVLPFSCFHYPRSSRKINVMRSLLHTCSSLWSTSCRRSAPDRTVTPVFRLKATMWPGACKNRIGQLSSATRNQTFRKRMSNNAPLYVVVLCRVLFKNVKLW